MNDFDAISHELRTVALIAENLPLDDIVFSLFHANIPGDSIAEFEDTLKDIFDGCDMPGQLINVIDAANTATIMAMTR